MIIILSPAKTLNFKGESPTQKYSNPIFIEKAEKLVGILQNFSPANLKELMNISNGLSELNYLRYQKWTIEHTLENSRQSIFAFNGEVFNGMNASTLKTDQLLFAQKHVRILSGLYGILMPLDLIQPYRLEMGAKLQFENFKNLYNFWNSELTNQLNQHLNNTASKALINLASNEYSKAVQLHKIKHPVITPVFKELKGNDYKVITVYAKKARGLMTRFIIEHKITDPEDVKHFDLAGYAYSENLSSDSEWIFIR